MPGLADLTGNAEYEKLSPDAKVLVFDKLSAQDDGFKKLSPEAQTIVKSKLVPQAAPQPDAERPGKLRPAEPWLPFMVDQAKKGVAGVASLPGMAVDTPNAVLKLIDYGTKKAAELVGAKGGTNLGSDYPFGGTANLYEGMSSRMGVKDVSVPKDEYGKPDKGAEYVGTLTNFLAANVLPGTGAVALATRKAPVAITEIIGTILSATSAVEGKEIGKDLLTGVGGLSEDEAGHLGSTIGAIFGPLAVGKITQASASKIDAGIDWLKEKTGISGFSKEAQKEAGTKMASSEITAGLQASPMAQPNMERAAELSGAIPGFKPDLAQASGAPGVIAIKQKLATQSPESLARAAGREDENVAAVQKFEGEKFPSSGASVTAPAAERYKALTTQNERNLAATDKQIEELGSKYAFQPNSDIGAQLRALRDKRQEQVRTVKTAKYNAVDLAAEKTGIREDVSDVKALMTEVAGSDSNAAQLMPELYADVTSAINKYKPKAGPTLVDATGKPLRGAGDGVEVPFPALSSMLRRANSDMRRAEMSGDATKAYYTGKVRDLLQSKVNKFEGAEYGDVATKLKDANRFFKQEYVQVFREGAGGKMGQFNRWGDVTADEDVVRKLLFKPNNERGVDDFLRIYGDHPEATMHLENGVKDVFAKAVVRDGEIQPRLVESFMRQHSQALDKMPKLKAELSKVDTANDVLLARRKEIGEQQKTLDSTALAKVAQIRNPEEAITAALKDPDKMRALLSQASKDPEASKAFARTVADHVGQQKDPFAYLMSNEKTLRPVMDKLGKSHWDNLAYIAEAKQVLARSKAPEHVELNKLQDIGEKTVGTPVKSIFSMTRQMMTQGPARVSPEYATLHLGGRYIFKIKQAEAEKLLEDAIYDPKVAESLRRMQVNPTKEVVDDFKLNASSHGIRVLGYAEQQKEEARK